MKYVTCRDWGSSISSFIDFYITRARLPSMNVAAFLNWRVCNARSVSGSRVNFRNKACAIGEDRMENIKLGCRSWKKKKEKGKIPSRFSQRFIIGTQTARAIKKNHDLAGEIELWTSNRIQINFDQLAVPCVTRKFNLPFIFEQVLSKFRKIACGIKIQ